MVRLTPSPPPTPLRSATADRDLILPFSHTLIQVGSLHALDHLDHLDHLECAQSVLGLSSECHQSVISLFQ